MIYKDTLFHTIPITAKPCIVDERKKDRSIVQSLSPIALFHNLIFVDTGDKSDAGFFKVNLAGGVYEAHGEDFSFEPFCLPVHSAGKVFSGRYTQVWHARILKWLINSRLLGYGSQPLCK